MTTADQISDLRSDIGADATSLPDEDAERLFVRAAARYPSNDDAALAYTRVLAIRQLLGSAASLVSYKANQASESLSDVTDHLRGLLELWQSDVDLAVRAGTGEMRWGAVHKKPARRKEYPDS